MAKPADIPAEKIVVRPEHSADNKDTSHSPVRCRRFSGPQADELFFLCRPDPKTLAGTEQAHVLE